MRAPIVLDTDEGRSPTRLVGPRACVVDWSGGPVQATFLVHLVA